MLTPPDLADESIVTCLSNHYGLRVSQVTFLPLGADSNAAVYRIDTADGTTYFLKLRRGGLDPVTVDVPAWLHAQGIQRVMAALPTTAQNLWVNAYGFDWLLYPFFVGNNGFEVALSPDQWVMLGETLQAIHTTVPPADLAARLPRENFGPHLRDRVRAYDRQVDTDTYDDPIAASLAAQWRTKHLEINALIDRAEQLGAVLRQESIEFVICHSDLHGGNVLVNSNNELVIVDWDEPILAPKERDLMFIGAGIGDTWTEAAEAVLFYQGYGPAAVDPRIIAYYRTERIVADLVAYGDQIFKVEGSVEDREDGLQKVMEQFLPNRVVEIAMKTPAHKVLRSS